MQTEDKAEISARCFADIESKPQTAESLLESCLKISKNTNKPVKDRLGSIVWRLELALKLLKKDA